MLDKSSKRLLEFLDSEPDSRYLFRNIERLPKTLSDGEDLFVAVRYLLVEIVTNQHDAFVGVQLSHTGRHRSEFLRLSLAEYLKEQRIAIIALAISLVALLSSLGLISLSPQ